MKLIKNMFRTPSIKPLLFSNQNPAEHYRAGLTLASCLEAASSCVFAHSHHTHVFGIWEDWGSIVHWRCCCCFLCVMQCHHHHHQQWWGVVQTTGWYQVKAVHLPAAERQIHNQTLVNEKRTATNKNHHLCCVCLSQCPFPCGIFVHFTTTTTTTHTYTSHFTSSVHKLQTHKLTLLL